MSEQIRIIAKVSELISDCDKLGKTAERSLKNSEKLLESSLVKVFKN